MRFATCLSFVVSLTSLNPQLQGAQAFGTDGEQPLIDASIHEFGLSEPEMLCTFSPKYQGGTNQGGTNQGGTQQMWQT